MDWTTSEEGRSNSSEQFKRLCESATDIIKHGAHDLINHGPHMPAGMIVCRLAHEHGLTPTADLALKAKSLLGDYNAPTMDNEFERRARELLTELIKRTSE